MAASTTPARAFCLRESRFDFLTTLHPNVGFLFLLRVCSSPFMNSMDPSNVAEDPYCIETELKDILTLNSCTTLISELIKFILYRKQQLPYTFDRLKYLITKRNAKEKQETVPNNASLSIEKQFKVAEDGLRTLELIFSKTKEELANAREGHISEVALLFGATPMTPKQVFRIHLPEICMAHSSVNHPERKQLAHLLQTVIHSNNLCNMLRKPMNPTNMYVFIRKKLKCGSVNEMESNLSKWFVPKNRYEIPLPGQHFHIKFRHPAPCLTSCCCQGFKIYSDVEAASEEGNGEKSVQDSDQFTAESSWYQACATFKGFTDVYINGISVADLWLR